MVAITSCGNSDSDNEPTPPEPSQSDDVSRTVLVYMAANNNLSANALNDIAEMKRGLTQGARLNGGRLLVYLTYPGKAPRLFEIDSDGTEHDIVTYATDISSLTIERMRLVVDDMRRAAPADEYGLILWSHGTGWLNDTGVITEPETEASGISPLSFGADGYPWKKMSIRSLARAIADVHWEFIYFDCCHMATVEVAYELRHLTGSIAGSVTELEIDGMPYHHNLECFFATTPDIRQAVMNTYLYYANQVTGPNEGCSMTLIDTSHLDRLAEATKAIYLSGAQPDGDYTPVPCFRKLVMSTGIFDMHHYMNSLQADPQLLQNWNEIFNMTVVAHHSTSEVYGLDTSGFHGLGSHILNMPEDAGLYGYDDTSWWHDVVSARFN